MSERQPRTRSAAQAAPPGSARPRSGPGSGGGPGSGQGGGQGGGKRGGRRRLSWPKRILLTLLGLFVLGVGAVGVAYAMIKTPKPNDYATAQASIIYYADGKTEMYRISKINRQSVPLAKVSIPMQHAILAAEDHSFYHESAISPTGIARAVWVAVKGGQATQGGSTITQQYVKNYFLSQDRTLSRKAKELLISVKIDQQQSKDQILENYLNTIYFGRGAYGIQTAAQAYFHENATELTASQGALLSAIVRGPSYYDPGLGAQQTANAKERWGYILDAMVKNGWMTAEQRAAATFPKTHPYRPPSVAGPNGYLIPTIKDELRNKYKLTDDDIDRGGLKIVSTIEKPKQQAAIAAVKDKMPSGDKKLHVGLASIKPGDGAVVALYGGPDYAKVQFSTATDATMQGGSTAKVFTLIGALQSGKVNTKSTFPGNSPIYFPEFKDPAAATSLGRLGGVVNFGNANEGTQTVCGATALSTNTIFARLNIIATPQRTAEAAKTAGITTPFDANYSNVFGTNNVKVLDMANAYATIAAQGKKATPYFVKSVTSADRTLQIKAKPSTTQVFDPAVMADVIDCMHQVTTHGTASYVGNTLGRPAAGKTGTTTGNYAAWFDGFTPQLATAVGIYKGDGSLKPANQMNNEPGVGELSGPTVPVYVWTEYMKAALSGAKVIDFPAPGHVNPDAQYQSTPTSSPLPQTSTTTSAAPTTSAPPTTSTPTPTPTPTPSTPTPTATPSGPPSTGGGRAHPGPTPT